MYIFFHGKTGYTVTSLILFRKIVTGAVTDGYTGGYCNQKRSYNPYPSWQPNRQKVMPIACISSLLALLFALPAVLFVKPVRSCPRSHPVLAGFAGAQRAGTWPFA